MKMNIRPIFRFRLRDTLQGAAVFVGIMIAVYAFFIVSAQLAYARNGSLSGATMTTYGVAAMITLFVFGICCVREDLRLCLQNGVSRRSMFAGTALASTVLAAVMAFAGEVLNTVSQALVAKLPNVLIADLYQLFYHTSIISNSINPMGFADHLKSIVMVFLLLCLSLAGGAFISLVFYRLPKFWKLVVAIGLPVLMMFGLPVAATVAPSPMAKLGELLYKVLVFAFNGYARSMLSLLLLALLAAACDWLLLRRAPIKTIK